MNCDELLICNILKNILLDAGLQIYSDLSVQKYYVELWKGFKFGWLLVIAVRQNHQPTSYNYE